MGLIRTIKKAFTVKGIGIHSGREITLKLTPGQEPGTIRFLFTDGFKLPVTPRYLSGGTRGTDLSFKNHEVKTIEHLLAACSYLNLWQLDIVFQDAGGSQEIPILDGSAWAWLQSFAAIGYKTLPAELSPMQVAQPLNVGSPSQYIRVCPADTLEIHCLTEFPFIGPQTVYYLEGKTDFPSQVAPARTFGLRSELEALQAQGLAQGASLENAFLLSEDGYSGPLRMPAEPAWHKLLDLMGDLAVLGRPLVARLEAYKPGHRLNGELVKLLAG